ncbi:MAG: DNA topoisomerase [Fusobacteriaceae bacterium]
MKKLIIAEKPSLAKNIAKALNINKRMDGYLENENYIVSWAFGHLFSLADVEDYTGVKKAWKDIELPFVPEQFKFQLKTIKKGKEKVVDVGAKKQFEILKSLADRADVDGIINCGDADREGQIIGDIIISKFGLKKPIYRLWLPDQTEKTIQSEIKALRDNKNYRNLADEGYARTFMDWLLGINMTIYLSVKSGKYLPVGRVLIPILKFIYDRDKAIGEFVKEKYFQIESKTKKNEIIIPLTVKTKYKTNIEAKEYASYLNKFSGVVEKIERKEIIRQPGKLFSLSKLQSILSKKEKMNFKNSEEIIQKLYENGYITYPRTNTEYLAENEKAKIKEIISAIKGYNLIFKDGKRFFDDSKIESHSAIIPTTKIPNMNSLSEKEALVYKVIQNRFICNFLNEETTTEKVTVEICVDKEKFILNGETIVKEGFFKFEPENLKNNLPPFIEGESFKINFKELKKETQPPKPVSEEELANHLKNPFRKEKQTEEEEYKAILEGVEIGTEATRTGIVEKAKFVGYISQKGSNYSIEELGKSAIEYLDKLKINLYKEKTVEFSKLLKQIYNGKIPLKQITETVEKELTIIVSSNIEIPREPPQFSSDKEIIGKCPKCGRNIYESEKSFYCSGYLAVPKCNISIWKENKFPQTKISKSNAKKLLKGEKVILKNIEGKFGKFDANYFLDFSGQYTNLKLESYIKNIEQKKD